MNLESLRNLIDYWPACISAIIVLGLPAVLASLSSRDKSITKPTEHDKIFDG